MKQNILKLTTAAFVGLFATSAHATSDFTEDEWNTFISLKPSLVKKVIDEVHDAGGSDAFEQILGAGGPDVVKNRIGAGGTTGADVDLDAQIARIEGGNPTLKVAIDDTKALINSGTPANTLLQDIQAEADIAEGGAAANLHAAIANRIAANPFPPAALLLVPMNAATAVNDINAQLDRIVAPRPASVTVGLDNVKTAVGIGGGATIVADIGTERDAIQAAQPDLKTAVDNTKALTGVGGGSTIFADIDAERGLLNAASGVGPAPADLHAAVAGLIGVVPAAGTLQKVTGATTLGTLNANLDTLRARIDATPAASIDAGLTSVELLVPHNVSLVADIGAVKATIDGAGATVANAVTNAAGKIGVGATIPLAITSAKNAVGIGGGATIEADIGTEAGRVENGQAVLKTAVDHVVAALKPGSNAGLLADVASVQTNVRVGGATNLDADALAARNTLNAWLINAANFTGAAAGHQYTGAQENSLYAMVQFITTSGYALNQ